MATGFLTSDGATYLSNLFSNTESSVSTYYVGLVTQPVGATQSGNELFEPTVDGYFRAPVSNTADNWYVWSNNLISITDVFFPVVTADPWVDLIGWAICDADSGGRVFYAGELDLTTVDINQQMVLPAGTISLSWGMNGWSDYQ